MEVGAVTSPVADQSPLDALMAQHGARPPAATTPVLGGLDALMRQHGAADRTPDFTTSNETDAAGHSVVKDPGVVRGVVDALDFITPLVRGYRAAAVDALRQGGEPPDPVAYAAQALATGVAQAHWNEIKKAVHAGEDGQVLEALAHGLAAVLPGVGPIAAKAGEDIAAGKPRYGVGEAIGTLVPLGLKGASEFASGARVPGALRNVNPVEAAAVDFGVDRGVPVSAGVATGNPFLRGTEKLIEHASPVSAYIGRKTGQASAEALGRVGHELADASNVGPAMDPVGAGTRVTDAIQATRDAHKATADAAYDRLRQIEADPARARTVTNTITGNMRGGGTVKLPQVTSMQLPVDLTDVKAALEPVYRQMQRQMPITQQQASTGLKAIENIVTGDDFAPLSQADRDLSAIKKVARSQGGLAKLAVGKFEAAVQKTVKAAGPDAIAALNEGRTATKAKVAAEDVLDRVQGRGGEAQAVYAKLTAEHDTNIALLQDVARTVPAEIPHVARAFLDDLLDTATAEGGFSKAPTLANRWRDLGDQTKAVLFPDADLRQNLNHFFLLAKKVGEEFNTSRSGYVGGIIAHSYLFRDPLSGLAYEIASAGLTTLLHSPVAVKALTKGFTVRISNTPAAIAATSRLLKLADVNGVAVRNVAGDRDTSPTRTGQR